MRMYVARLALNRGNCSPGLSPVTWEGYREMRSHKTKLE